jgi:hypothetical protein
MSFKALDKRRRAQEAETTRQWAAAEKKMDDSRIHNAEIRALKQTEKDYHEQRRKMQIRADAEWKVKHPHLDKAKTAAKVIGGAAAVGGVVYGGVKLHQYYKKHYKK